MGDLLEKFWSEMLLFLFGIVGTQGYNSWLNKRKNKADAESVEIDNDEKTGHKWRAYAEKIESRLSINEAAIETLKLQHEECEKSKDSLHDEIRELKRMMS